MQLVDVPIAIQQPFLNQAVCVCVVWCVVWCVVCAGLTFDAVVRGHSTVYTDNLEEYQAIAALVMDPAMRPINIHCAAGSMRTGFTVALIQLILGVTEVSVYEDFLLTNEVLGSTYDELLEEFRGLIFANTHSEPTEQDMANLSNMVIMYSEYLEAALYHVRDVYGSIDAYIPMAS